MGVRKVVVRQSAADNISAIALFIESKGLISTAEKFSNLAYDFLEMLGNSERSFSTCREPYRALLGFKCLSYKKKYTIVFIESARELLICEFIPSKMIYW